MRTKKTVITSERHEVLVIRQAPAGAARAWCADCAAEVWMLRPEQAAGLTGASTRAIYRRAEAGLLHFAETVDGLLLVCPKSLLSGGRLLPPCEPRE